MEHIPLVYNLTKQIVTAIMVLNKDPKTTVHSPNGDTDVFDVVLLFFKEVH